MQCVGDADEEEMTSIETYHPTGNQKTKKKDGNISLTTTNNMSQSQKMSSQPDILVINHDEDYDDAEDIVNFSSPIGNHNKKSKSSMATTQHHAKVKSKVRIEKPTKNHATGSKTDHRMESLQVEDESDDDWDGYGDKETSLMTDFDVMDNDKIIRDQITIGEEAARGAVKSKAKSKKHKVTKKVLINTSSARDTTDTINAMLLSRTAPAQTSDRTSTKDISLVSHTKLIRTKPSVGTTVKPTKLMALNRSSSDQSTSTTNNSKNYIDDRLSLNINKGNIMKI